MHVHIFYMYMEVGIRGGHTLAQGCSPGTGTGRAAGQFCSHLASVIVSDVGFPWERTVRAVAVALN